MTCFCGVVVAGKRHIFCHNFSGHFIETLAVVPLCSVKLTLMSM
jgi:hypothetical protein